MAAFLPVGHICQLRPLRRGKVVLCVFLIVQCNHSETERQENRDDQRRHERSEQDNEHIGEERTVDRRTKKIYSDT